MRTTKMKTLDKNHVLANINGLSEGDRAYCGPYGTITCTKAAKNTATKKRAFKVQNSKKLRNGGLWTMARLRKAIAG